MDVVPGTRVAPWPRGGHYERATTRASQFFLEIPGKLRHAGTADGYADRKVRRMILSVKLRFFCLSYTQLSYAKVCYAEL